jgi:hypothetical protein
MIALLIIATASANNYRVTSTSDGPPAACSFVAGVDYDCTTLRDAVAAANAAPGADVISFMLGSGPATITLTNVGSGEDANSTGDLDITEAVTINGPNWMYYLVIDAAGFDRAFDVHSTSGNVQFNTIDITGGLVAGPGGCVRSMSDVGFREVLVHGCTATSGGGGGAYVDRNANVFVSAFDDNAASVSGGALQVVGNVNVDLTSFGENVASGGDGGAIWTSGSDISVVWGIFTSNWADGNGGAVYIDPASTATVAMAESVLRSNGASGGYGGGLDARNSTVAIERVEVTRNQALFAGAMHFEHSLVYVADTTVSYNATVGIPVPFSPDHVTAAIHFGGDEPDAIGYDESDSVFECESCTMVCNPVGSDSNGWEPGSFLVSTWGDAEWEHIEQQGCPTAEAIGYVDPAPADAAYLTIHNTLIDDNCGYGMSSTGYNVVLSSACNNDATDITSTDANKHYNLATNLAAPFMTHRIKKPYAAHNGAACMPSPDLDGRGKARGPTGAPNNADSGCDVGAFELTMSEHTDGIY